MRLSCNSYGADESTPLSLLPLSYQNKLQGRSKGERKLSVIRLTEGSKAGYKRFKYFQELPGF
jgi:hypothetical protein